MYHEIGFEHMKKIIACFNSKKKELSVEDSSHRKNKIGKGLTRYF